MRQRRGIGTDYTSEGKRNAELQKQLDALDDRVSALNTNQGTADPAPCTPDFAIAYTPKKGRLRGTFCAEIPVGMQVISATIIPDEFYNVDQETFDANKIIAEVDIDPDASALGHVEWLFPPVLDFETTYHLMRLAVVDGNGIRYRNPPGALLFNSPALASFTTPADAEAPARPHVGNIIENNLDDSTSRKFDAWVTVQIIAPASATNNLTGTVAVNGTTTVTGSGTSFLTGIAVGNGIEVNGETHIVTNVGGNTTLTVDYPFSQTASGQTATRKVLMTFDEAGIIAIAPKFRAVGDTESKAISPHFPIDDELGVLTNAKVKVLGFPAGRRHNWVRNLAVGASGERHTSDPLSTQTFTPGNFTEATAGIPEWSTAPVFQYDATDPQNDNRRLVSLRITQTSPPIAIDKVQLYRRNTGTGTVSASTTTLTGSGTSFTTELAKGHYIIVGAQTLEIANITNNTTATLVAAPSPSFSGQTFTISVLKDDFSLQIGKFHPSAGGLIPPIKFGEIKTKKLTNFTFAAIIYALNGQTRTITESFTTGADGEVAADTAAPSGLATPSLEWTAEGRFKVQGMQATTNIHTLKERYLVITDNAGNYADLTADPPVVTTTEADARYATGNKGHINLSWVKLKKWRNVFGASTTIFAYWYAENDIGVSSASSLSTGVSLATPYDHMGDRDTIRGLDVESTLTSPGNILGNGDVILQDAPGEVKQILRWNPAGLPIEGSAVAIDNATANLRWDTTSHSIRWLTTTMQLVMPLKKRLQPGETYAFTMLIRSTTAGGWSTTVKLHFYNGQRTTSTVDNIEDTIDLSVTFNDTAYHLLGAVIQMKQSPDLPVTSGGADYANHFFAIELSAVTNDVYMDKFMMVRGEQPLAYAPRGSENDSGTVFVVPTFIAQPDIVEISGTAGGWREPNDGIIVL